MQRTHGELQRWFQGGRGHCDFQGQFKGGYGEFIYLCC